MPRHLIAGPSGRVAGRPEHREQWRQNPPSGVGQRVVAPGEQGLGTFRELLVEVAKSPAMIFWMDNHGYHDGAINENWGRELLELFPLGVGNYSEDDIREVARAFTGWTIAPNIPRNPYGRFHWQFEYKPEDHDDREKTFLGHTGNFNGEDVIDIIVEQPASRLHSRSSAHTWGGYNPRSSSFLLLAVA